MITRYLVNDLTAALAEQPAVALLGPRQVGKTTLALSVTNDRAAIYLDLERPADREKLKDPEIFLAVHQDKLVILDEIQRQPELFQILRGLIDEGRRQGREAGQFLLLGSASLELLKQASESLAGRIAHLELCPIDVLEIENNQLAIEKLWLRGGFPRSYLASSDNQSFSWRSDFIRTYLERDVPMFGFRVPAETLHRFWTMLAHEQGGLFNASAIATSLGVSSPAIGRYTDLMVDLLLVRRLQPYHVNVKKRLVKSPKVYIRDSGIVHALLGIVDRDSLFGHPVSGMSWEGFIVETLIHLAPTWTIPGFYRTSAGAEIDLVLEFPGKRLWAIEIKQGLTPKVGKGFHIACEDLAPEKCFVVYSGTERYPLAHGVEAIGLAELAEEIRALNVR